MPLHTLALVLLAAGGVPGQSSDPTLPRTRLAQAGCSTSYDCCLRRNPGNPEACGGTEAVPPPASSTAAPAPAPRPAMPPAVWVAPVLLLEDSPPPEVDAAKKQPVKSTPQETPRDAPKETRNKEPKP